MSSSYYRTEKVWEAQDFPHPTDSPSMTNLTKVAPSCYEYVYIPCEDWDRVELREYVGEDLNE